MSSKLLRLLGFKDSKIKRRKHHIIVMFLKSFNMNISEMQACWSACGSRRRAQTKRDLMLSQTEGMLAQDQQRAYFKDVAFIRVVRARNQQNTFTLTVIIKILHYYCLIMKFFVLSTLYQTYF